MTHAIFTEEHELFRKSVRAFVEKECWPTVDRWEEAGLVPREIYRRMGELGFLGLRYPEEYGGAGADIFMTVAFCEELARCRSGGFAMGTMVHTDMASPHIARQGTPEQKERYLRPIIAGEKICAIAVTEPGGGSDVAGMRTTAERKTDRYILNGSKMFITNAVIADIFVVAAKTDAGLGHRGISMFIVEKGTPGFHVSRKLDKLGMRASDTGELVFEDCPVPAENLLGEEHQGFYETMRNFQDERLVIAIWCYAAAQQALEDTIAYARQRPMFGRQLAEFQITRHKIADLATLTEAARALCYETARRYADGADCVKEVSMCKAFCADVANRVATDCLQMHGGYGYMKEFSIERFFRDARLYPIGGGSTETMREIIAKRMGLYAPEWVAKATDRDRDTVS